MKVPCLLRGCKVRLTRPSALWSHHHAGGASLGRHRAQGRAGEQFAHRFPRAGSWGAPPHPVPWNCASHIRTVLGDAGSPK